jgi:hypothetical protein
VIEKINEIDWTALDNAYNDSSEEIASLLVITYRDRNSEAFENLLASIHNDLIHQGTIYTATATALPFIIDLLKSSPDEFKKGFIRFISGTANGVDQYFTFVDVGTLQSLPHELSFLGEIAVTLWSEIDYFKSLLDHEDQTIRRIIPYLLNSIVLLPTITLPDHLNVSAKESEIVDCVVDHAVFNDSDSFARCSYAYLLKTLAHKNEKAMHTIHTLFKLERDRLVKICLAMILADHKHYEEALPTLQDALNNIEATDQLNHNELMWLYGRLHVYIIATLCRFPPNYLPALTDTFVNVISASNSYNADSDLAYILDFIFKGKKLSTDGRRVSLSNEERRILHAIYNHGKLLGTNSGGLLSVFKRTIGIDDDPSTWKKILEINAFC